MSQLEARNKQIEVRNARREHITLRSQWMRAKTVKTYQTEYHRIRNHLSNTTTPGITREQATNRIKVLECLGARAFATIT